jgi:hypothetical protein
MIKLKGCCKICSLADFCSSESEIENLIFPLGGAFSIFCLAIVNGFKTFFNYKYKKGPQIAALS